MNTSTRAQFLESYDLYADDIFRHCAFRTSDREVGKELMQDTFMRTWEYIERGKTVQHLRAFLYRTANNLIVDFMRKHTKQKTISLEDMIEEGKEFESASDTTAETKRVFSDKQVQSLLQKIPEPYRTAVVMRYIDELSPAEIADTLAISPNVTSVRINRGMQKLRSLLPSHG